MAVVDDREATLLKIGIVQLLILGLLTYSLIASHKNLTLLLLLLLAFVAIARLWSRFSCDHLSVSSCFDRDRIFPGEAVEMEIRAENRKVLPVWLRVTISFPAPVEDGSAGQVQVQEQGLLWYQAVRLRRQLRPQHRGIYRIGPPQVVSGDLLGIYPRELTLPQKPLDLVVFPRLLPLRPFAHIKKDLFGSPGGKRPVEDPIYLMGTRDYHNGRPSRYIHWIASARLNRLQERVFEPSRQARVLLIVDVEPFAATMAAACFERAVSVVASLAVDCERQGFAVGLVTNGSITGKRSPLVAVARSAQQTSRILETLAGVELRCRQAIGKDLLRAKGLDSGLSCILFTLFQQGSAGEAIPRLLRKNLAITTVYCDNSGLPASGILSLDHLLPEREPA
jgi:uncharacterized protein (DUF58 family)